MRHCTNLFFAMCILLTSCVYPFVKDDTSFDKVINSFMHIRKTEKISISSCHDLYNLGRCDVIVSSLPPLEMNSTGSGTLIEWKGRKLGLTAAHICESAIPKSITKDGVKLDFSVEVNLQICFIDSEKSIKAGATSSDTKNDLCVFQVSLEIHRIGLTIAKTMPKIGDVVRSAGAPQSVFEKGMVLNFDGRYSGRTVESIDYYTIPASPGSSGSSIVDNKNNVVGVLHSAIKVFENVAICASLEAIHALLERH